MIGSEFQQFKFNTYRPNPLNGETTINQITNYTKISFFDISKVFFYFIPKNECYNLYTGDSLSEFKMHLFGTCNFVRSLHHVLLLF